jgi:hypothetical protein
MTTPGSLKKKRLIGIDKRDKTSKIPTLAVRRLKNAPVGRQGRRGPKTIPEEKSKKGLTEGRRKA